MIHLSRREQWLICGILLAFVLGNIVWTCRRPYLEYVPGKVEAGWRTMTPAEPEPAEEER